MRCKYEDKINSYASKNIHMQKIKSMTNPSIIFCTLMLLTIRTVTCTVHQNCYYNLEIITVITSPLEMVTPSNIITKTLFPFFSQLILPSGVILISNPLG